MDVTQVTDETSWAAWVREKIEVAARNMHQGDRPRRAWWNGYHDGMRLRLAHAEGESSLFILGSACLYDEIGCEREAVNYLAGLNGGFDSVNRGFIEDE